MAVQNVFAAVTDERHLRSVHAALDELLQASDGAGPAELRAMAAQRRGWARSRITDLRALGAERRPVVVDPALHLPVGSRQGQPMTEVVTGEVVGETALCSAVVTMPAWHRAKAHVHDVTDVLVVVMEGSATTVWWDLRGAVHTVEQSAGQHLLIPAGVPHAAVSGSAAVRAIEVRANRDIGADNQLMPELDGEVMALQVRMRSGAGAAA